MMATDRTAVSLEALSVSMGQLESLWRAKQEVGEQFKECVDAVAQKAGLQPNVVKAYVDARCKDKVQKAKRTLEQLALVFDMLS